VAGTEGGHGERQKTAKKGGAAKLLLNVLVVDSKVT